MKQLKMIGLCLLAALAVAALAAGAASAKLPEWGGCEATAGGKYSDAACTVKARHRHTEGQYEWYTGAQYGTVFEHEHGLLPSELSTLNLEDTLGPTTFETAAGHKVQCASGIGRMQLENADTSAVHKVVFSLSECESEGQECHSQFYPAGEVNNEQSAFEESEENEENEGWHGHIADIEGKGTPTPVVGLSLTTQQKGHRLLLAICTGPVGTVWIGGNPKGGDGVIATITPIDQMTNEFTQTYSESTPGVQAPQGFEHQRLQILKGLVKNQWEPLAMLGSITTVEESGTPPIEIKAVS